MVEKSINKLIDLATPDSEGRVREAQIEAIKSILDPRKNKSDAHYERMLKLITEEPSGN